ncbi:Uncharacterised protein [Vibrio cholerae]|nr:Uncharacterised protein [Vibrio cholerae]
MLLSYLFHWENIFLKTAIILMEYTPSDLLLH